MSGKAKTVVILLVLSWLAVGVVVSYLANDGLWFALAIGLIVIVGLAG